MELNIAHLFVYRTPGCAVGAFLWSRHTAYALPRTVVELKRILRLHLAESGGARSLVIRRRSEPSVAVSKTR